MKKAGIFILASFAFALLVSPIFTVRAQSIGTTSLDGVDIAMSPINPAPGVTVTVTVTSYTTDLNGASVSWFIGGKSSAKGTGVTSITLQAPSIGKSVQVLADIETVEGADIQKVVTVRSSSIDMIVETSGYVPPLYRGKNPSDYENTLRIIAIPHLATAAGVPIDPKNLIYTWKRDSTVLGSQSGFGKQVLSVQGAIIPRPFAIYVDVSSKDGSVHGESNIGVAMNNPSISFYEDDPLYGVLYNEAVGNSVELIHNQIKISSVPYGFDTSATGGSLAYGWTVNDTYHPELAANPNIILVTPSGSSGTSNVSLNIENTTDILQTATAGFSAIFNQDSAQQSGQSTVSF